jgi:hypothetical protein
MPQDGITPGVSWRFRAGSPLRLFFFADRPIAPGAPSGGQDGGFYAMNATTIFCSFFGHLRQINILRTARGRGLFGPHFRNGSKD